MNSLLPDDIRILQCQLCNIEFNSNKDSRSKEYHYYFCADKISNPIFNDIVEYIPFNKYAITSCLDIELMQEACKLFIGDIALQNETLLCSQHFGHYLLVK